MVYLGACTSGHLFAGTFFCNFGVLQVLNFVICTWNGTPLMHAPNVGQISTCRNWSPQRCADYTVLITLSLVICPSLTRTSRTSDSVGRPSRRYVRRMRLRHRSSSGHRVIKQEKSKFKMEPVRRSTREKRLVFATLNLSEIDKQIQDPKHGYPELDSSEVCKCVCVCVWYIVSLCSQWICTT